jgi:hypothetical protein
LNAKLALLQVAVHEIQARHVKGQLDPTLSFSLDMDAVTCARAANAVMAVYPLTVTIEHVDGKAREPLAIVRVAMRLEYTVAETFTHDDEPYVEDYLGIVGWVHAWPYLRAEVSDLSTRLGFPALLIPVLLAGQTANIPVRWEAPAATVKKARKKKSRDAKTAR